MNSHGNHETLSSLETERLAELQAIVERGLDTAIDVRDSLIEIRDRRLYRGAQKSFEAYLRDRWAITGSRSQSLMLGSACSDASNDDPDPIHKETSSHPGERAAALATAWDQVLQHFETDHVAALEVRLTVGEGPKAAPLAHKPASPAAELPSGKLLAELRSLLTQSGGTIAAVAHHVETRAADLGEEAREQLRDDLAVLDDDMMTLKALLAVPVDWDAEYGRLLAGEIPPADEDDHENDER